jgi:hypothetical protein
VRKDGTSWMGIQQRRLIINGAVDSESPMVTYTHPEVVRRTATVRRVQVEALRTRRLRRPPRHAVGA